VTILRRAWFTGLLTVVAIVLLVRTLELSPAGRHAPLWVVSTTLALLGLQLAFDLVPGMARHFPILQHDSLFGAAEQLGAVRRRGMQESTPEQRRRREVRIVLWIAGLVALVRVVGFLWAIPIFLVPYLRAESRVGWVRAMLVSAVTAGLAYLIFRRALGLPFPEGIIG